MPVPNLPSSVAVTDTFEEWRLKTNLIITALTNDTILYSELPSIAANTILGNSSMAAATPDTITVLSKDGITMSSGALKLVTPLSIGGISMTNSGALALDAGVAGAGLALTNGVLSVNAGAGLSLTSDILSVNAGAGLALTNGVLSVNAGAGLALNGDILNIALTTTGSSGLTASSGLKFVTGALTNGLIPQINAGLGISLANNGGLAISSTGLGIALDTNKGLALSTAGLGISLATNSGLKLDAAGVGINFNINNFQISSGELTLSNTLATKVTRGTAYAFMTWNSLGAVVTGSNYNCSKSWNGFNHIITFTNPLPDATYTVIAYCSDGIVTAHNIGSDGAGGLLNSINTGQINIGNKGSTGFAVNSFTGNLYMHDDNSQSWSLHPYDQVHNSIVVYI